MSTRAQVIIKDEHDEQWFYRHSDGYPEGTLPSLNKFLDWVKQGRLRDNVLQSSGWLVLIGAREYDTDFSYQDGGFIKRKKREEEFFEPCLDRKGDAWKVGAYEPCMPIEHGDTEYLYTIDLNKKTVTYVEK